jgi:hypothetical protein
VNLKKVQSSTFVNGGNRVSVPARSTVTRKPRPRAEEKAAYGVPVAALYRNPALKRVEIETALFFWTRFLSICLGLYPYVHSALQLPSDVFIACLTV